MEIDKRIKDILACPVCKRRLKVFDDDLVCENCEAGYKVWNGVPLLLSADAEKEVDANMQKWGEGAIVPKIPYKLLKKLKSPAVHRWKGESKFVKELVEGLQVDAVCIDIGSGAQYYSSDIIRVDIGPFKDVKLAGDAQALPVIDNSLDCVLIHRVLEHVDNPYCAVNEIYRALKPGGVVSAVVPFFEPYHRNPSDNSRFCKDGIEKLFGMFKKEKLEWVTGPSVSVIWIMKEYLALLMPFSNNKYVYASVRELAGWLLSPLKLVDCYMRSRKYSHKIAGAFHFVGRKAK